MSRKYRLIKFYGSYFEDFFSNLELSVQNKFIWTFQLIEELDRVPSKYLKNIGQNLYEVRVKVGTNIYRAFGFFDSNEFVIILNAYQKKSQKVSRIEIRKALKIKKQYEQES